MSKYTRRQLQGMAQEYLKAQSRGDLRCLELTTIMMLRTGLPDHEVHNRIVAMAQSPVSEHA